MAMLGWSLDDHTEIISREMLVKHFDLDRVLPNPAVFNAEKLLWMNGMYIRDMPAGALAEAVLPYLERDLGHPVDRAVLARIVPLVQERIKVLSEITAMTDFFFLNGHLDYDTETLLGKKYAGQAAQAADALSRVVAAVDCIDAWTHEGLEGAVRPLAEELGVKAGDLFGLIRVAVTGKTATPPLFETMEVLGRQVTLQRLRVAIERL
jgi:glutamyl-tRNA synthetase